MVRAWRIVGAAGVLIGYFVLAAPVGYAAFALWAALPNPHPRHRARRFQAIMTLAFGSMHALLRWLRLIHFDPGEVEGVIPDEPCVLVANHPTLVDISAMIACERNLVFPVKASLFRAYWARPMLQAADQFEAAEQDLFGIGGVVESAMERLSQGYRVIIFPEGTRSPAGGMHPFGRMAFEIARRQNVPIVPLVITCEPRWLTRENSFLNPPGPLPRMRIRALKPVDPRAEGSSSRTLRDMIYSQIRQELGLPVSGSESSDLSPPEAEVGPCESELGSRRV